MVKLLLKLIWLGFGAFGVVTVGQKYLPKVDTANLVRGVQTSLVSNEAKPSDKPLTVSDLRNLDPETAGRVLGETVKTEITRILETTGEEVKTFPAKQVKKIKIGACEDLLEQDICSIAKEIKCE